MVVVYGIAELLQPLVKPLSAAIHASLCEVLGLPEGKRAHRFVPQPRDSFYHPDDRSDAYTEIEVHLMQGRTVETKRRLIHRLFERIEADVGIVPRDVEITLQEQPPHCWGFRGMTGDEARLDYKIEV
jgi:phenylpyruvate tautomerase PptA (4-oxalocrotonate tautomerase family)